MEQALRIARLEQREKDRFGDRIAPGGDMYRQHLDFIAWAKSYDTGGMNMRSKAKHDAWQKLLSCEILHLDGANTVEEHLARVKEILDRK
jgi:hypothetical protein